jgi:hypothetical protein
MARVGPPFAQPASGTQEESAETSAETFPLQIGAFHELRATLRPRTLPAEIQKSPELQALSSVDARISTMRAPVSKEAWLAVERGPYLLGFSQMGRRWTEP